MTTNHRLNGFLLAGLLGMLTVILLNHLSPTRIGPATAGCYYLIVGLGVITPLFGLRIEL